MASKAFQNINSVHADNDSTPDNDYINAVSTLLIMADYRSCISDQETNDCGQRNADGPVGYGSISDHETNDCGQRNSDGPVVFNEKKKRVKVEVDVKAKHRFIGAHRYKRTHRWEAYIWLSNPSKQIWLGLHSCAEAAARTSDKAQLALRDRSKRKLNYPATDYRKDYIKYLKSLDARDMPRELREQAKGNSEGCLMGLTEPAADKLREAISQAGLDK